MHTTITLLLIVACVSWSCDKDTETTIKFTDKELKNTVTMQF